LATELAIISPAGVVVSTPRSRATSAHPFFHDRSMRRVKSVMEREAVKLRHHQGVRLALLYGLQGLRTSRFSRKGMGQPSAADGHELRTRGSAGRESLPRSPGAPGTVGVRRSVLNSAYACFALASTPDRAERQPLRSRSDNPLKVAAYAPGNPAL
jgi:hypothetical protein